MNNSEIFISNVRNSTANFKYIKDGDVIINTKAYLGENGVTKCKREGDGTTPLGRFKTGIAFGIHNINVFDKKIQLKYIQINKNLYWVDDVNSTYYNMLVDKNKIGENIEKISAEHLIEYPRQYEYAVEIKTNPLNIRGKGSAIFLHCSVDKPTRGCIAISKLEMKKVLENINENTVIYIEK